MLRHGWLFIGIFSLLSAVPLASAPASATTSERPPLKDRLRISTNPPVPSPIDPESMDEREWRYIIELLCIIIPCRPTDPDTETIESATACLHVRLDRFESEGLNANLDQPTIETWIANIDSLASILSESNWDVFVADAQERDSLLDQLETLKSALQAQVSAAREIARG